ncbi:hypothetical protein QBC40DRAFT_215882 [Triangularia verruculosa]|uniref:T6SS Phospholipase effector Tle1-like catalytic domain-containing protein n=1 Tax=Triangularia verruculosa TaxID=2587418 RepID=A0AAN7AZ99_9PEZI|nr:hypothetical protein QBC40DRAFT_215882 [Triangularia verruculosa]
MASELETTPPPYKRIIVCCDGTAATAYDYRDVGKKPFTNVSRISRSIRPQSRDGIPQVVLYLPGVGTAEGNIFNMWNRGYGIGLDEKIIEAYSFICHNYRSAEENNGIADQIFLMGYSRGAFTVRCVADIINKAGLLRKEGICYVGNLYSLWRMEKQIPPPSSPPQVGHPNLSPTSFRGIDTTFQQDPRLRHYPVRVKVCALWDTVNSTFHFRWGRPKRRFTFVDSECCEGIDNVIQALALHETRRPYRPIVLKRPVNNQVRLEQCWFAGKHSDIGRGKKGQDLDNFPLIWALDKLSEFLDLDLDVVWKTEPGRPTCGSKSSLDRNPREYRPSSYTMAYPDKSPTF